MTFFSKNFFFNNEKLIEKTMNLDPYWYKYAYINLFSKVGAHIGHTIKNSVRQAAWMIYGYKWDLVIINLSITIIAIKASFVLVSGCASKSRPFWFVTQDKTFYRYSRYLAIKCGEFSSTLYWIRGMASNFSIISTTYFSKRPKYVFMRKDRLFDLNFSDWFFTRLSWPGGMLLSSIFHSSFATLDSLKGKVGCAGLLDSNANSKNCTLVIPSNDDSIDWIVFINDVFSEYILIKKLWGILRWHYYVIKRIDRSFFFEKWMSLNLKDNLKFNRRIFSKKFGKYSIFYFPLWYISSINSGFSPIIENLKVSYSLIDVSQTKKLFEKLFSSLLLKKKLLSILSTFSFYGRPLYNIFSNINFNFFSESNFEMSTPYSLKYFLYNHWYFKKRFSGFYRRYDHSTFFRSVYIIKFLF